MDLKIEERKVIALVESFNGVVVVNNPTELLQILAEPHPLHRQLAMTHWKAGNKEVTVIPTTGGHAACVVQLPRFQANKMIQQAVENLEKASKAN